MRPWVKEYDDEMEAQKAAGITSYRNHPSNATDADFLWWALREETPRPSWKTCKLITNLMDFKKV